MRKTNIFSAEDKVGIILMMKVLHNKKNLNTSMPYAKCIKSLKRITKLEAGIVSTKDEAGIVSTKDEAGIFSI